MRSFSIAMLICTLCVLQPTAVQAEESGTLTLSQGAVYKRGFADEDKTEWAPPAVAAQGDAVEDGMQIGTGRNSLSEVRWGNITLRSAENTVYTMMPKKNLVYVVGGEFLFNHDRKRGDSDYTIWTEHVQVVAKGTTLLFQQGSNGSRVSVIEGVAEITNRLDKSIVTLTPGMSYVATAKDTGRRAKKQNERAPHRARAKRNAAKNDSGLNNISVLALGDVASVLPSVDGVSNALPIDGVTSMLPLDAVTSILPLDTLTSLLPIDSATSLLPLDTATGVLGEVVDDTVELVDEAVDLTGLVGEVRDLTEISGFVTDGLTEAEMVESLTREGTIAAFSDVIGFRVLNLPETVQAVGDTVADLLLFDSKDSLTLLNVLTGKSLQNGLLKGFPTNLANDALVEKSLLDAVTGKRGVLSNLQIGQVPILSSYAIGEDLLNLGKLDPISLVNFAPNSIVPGIGGQNSDLAKSLGLKKFRVAYNKKQTKVNATFLNNVGGLTGKNSLLNTSSLLAGRGNNNALSAVTNLAGGGGRGGSLASVTNNLPVVGGTVGGVVNGVVNGVVGGVVGGVTGGRGGLLAPVGGLLGR